MDPFVRRFMLYTLVPERPYFDRRSGIGQLVGRDLVCLLQCPGQRTGNDRRQVGIPEQRRQGKWTITVETTGRDGRAARGEVEGTDGYGTTAAIAVEAARRLVVDGAKPGVLAPSQAFDPESFLGFLSGHGVRWRVTPT